MVPVEPQDPSLSALYPASTLYPSSTLFTPDLTGSQSVMDRFDRQSSSMERG